MAYAILNRNKWEIAKGNLEEYKKLGGKVFEGTNEEVESYPKFVGIFDEIKKAIKKAIKPKKIIKPETEKEKKLKEIEKKIKEIAKKTKKIKKEVAKKVKK